MAVLDHRAHCPLPSLQAYVGSRGLWSSWPLRSARCRQWSPVVGRCKCTAGITGKWNTGINKNPGMGKEISQALILHCRNQHFSKWSTSLQGPFAVTSLKSSTYFSTISNKKKCFYIWFYWSFLLADLYTLNKPLYLQKCFKTLKTNYQKTYPYPKHSTTPYN